MALSNTEHKEIDWEELNERFDFWNRSNDRAFKSDAQVARILRVLAGLGVPVEWVEHAREQRGIQRKRDRGFAPYNSRTGRRKRNKLIDGLIFGVSSRECNMCGYIKPLSEEHYFRKNAENHYRTASLHLIRCHGFQLACINCVIKNRVNSGIYRIGARAPHPDGYVYVCHPERRRRNPWIPEHIMVMENHIGRQLKKGECVHHKNGIRADNNLGNLELWATVHCSGQRPKDLVAFALEVLGTYQEDLESGLF